MTFCPKYPNYPSIQITDPCFQHEKGVLSDSWYEGTKRFTPSPKNGFLAQKRPNLAQNWHFRPNMGIFCPFDPIPDHKTMWTSCLGGFSVMWLPKLLFAPIKIRFLAQNQPILVQNMQLWSFWAKYWYFLPISCNVRPRNNANKMLRWVFRFVGNKTFDFSSKKRIFCLKKTKFSPKLAFLSIAGSFGALLWGWQVVFGAGCIWQDTYLLYLGCLCSWNWL